MNLTNEEKEQVIAIAIKDAAKTLATTFTALNFKEPIDTIIAEEKRKIAYRLTFEELSYEQAMLEKQEAIRNGTVIHDETKKPKCDN